MDDIDVKTLKRCSRVSLPMELIFSDILPKLPAKSLLRFKCGEVANKPPPKCVSKSFLREISSHKFNASFFEANRLFLLPDESNTFHLYKLDSIRSPPTICPFPIPSQWCALLLACCESYVFIGCKNINPQSLMLILLNPITRFYRILPKGIPTLSDFVQYGMCHCSDDFKVIRITQSKVPYKNVREVMVYSLRTNLWRTIECKRNIPEWCDKPILVQNHLLVMILMDRYCLLKRIGCFDMKAERWSYDVLLPDIVSGEIRPYLTEDDGYYYVGVLDGKFRFTWYNVKKSTYSVWVLKKYGDKSSWLKLMSLPVQGMEEVYHPIAHRKGSSHELLCISHDSNKYLWYNLRDKQFTDSGGARIV